jgi:hypothetical protein
MKESIISNIKSSKIIKKNKRRKRQFTKTSKKAK